MAILRGKDALEFQRRKAQDTISERKHTSAAAGRENAKMAERKNKKSKRGGRRANTKGRSGALNIDAFDAAMRKFENSAIDWSLQFYRDWVSDLYIAILGNTPILTGRARANWQWGKQVTSFSIIAPDGTYPDPLRPNLARIESELTDLDQSFIFNNVAYIADLDAGSSPNASDGIVDPAILEVGARMGAYMDALDAAVSFEDLSDREAGFI